MDPMQELYLQLKQADHQSPAHTKLIRAIEDLEQTAKPYRRFQNRKQLPTVKAQDKALLMQKHQAIGAAAEALLAGQESDELKDMVRKISALSSANYRALLEYDPSKTPKTLDSIEEQSRTLVLHVGEGEIGKAENLGAVQSERMPLAFLDENGKKITGLFTRKKNLTVTESFCKALDDTLAQARNENSPHCAALQQAFDVIKQKIKQPGHRVRPVGGKTTLRFIDDPAANICQLMDLCTDGEIGDRYIDPEPLGDMLGQLLPEELKQKLPADAFGPLAEKLDEMRGASVVNILSAKIPDGGRIDSRNSAMSAVADLLGMSNVIARARPMKVVGPDGTVVEGTFMEVAKGMDPKNLDEDALLITTDSLKGTDGRAFRDIANIQILDYICGNVDRHAGNFAYRFDKNNKLIGIQGFDNDCSFGVRTFQNGKGGNRLVGTRNMRAIPIETYRRVMSLTPETLKYTLRGFGLSEPEMDAAGKRLQELQRDLRREVNFYNELSRKEPGRPLLPGHIRVLRPEEWRNYPMDNFSKEFNGEYTNNTFKMAHLQVRYMRSDYRKQLKEFNDLQQTVAAGIQNRGNRSTIARELEKAAALKKTLSNRTWKGFSSDNYRDLQSKVKAYTDYMQQLKERLAKANSEDEKRKASYHGERDAVVTQQDLERMRELSRQMKQAAEKYLAGKLVNGEIPANASSYTKSRIAIAKEVKKYAQMGEAEARPEETLTLRENEAKVQRALERHKERAIAEIPPTPKIDPIVMH